MDKCCNFNTLLLVYLVAAINSEVVYECQTCPTPKDECKKKMDLRVSIASDTDIMKTRLYLCNVTITVEFEATKLVCVTKESLCPVPCSDTVTPVCAVSTSKQDFQPLEDNMSHWSNWSECVTSEKGYRHRSLVCNDDQSKCLILSNGSSSDISNCTIESAPSSTAKEKEAEKRYTLTDIILVAFGCFLLGAMLSALLFLIYIKRTQRGFFSKHANDAESNSKQKSRPDLKFLTESVVKKYEGNKSKSSHSNKENIAEETHYQSLESNQVGKDQQTYDELKVKESRSGHQGVHPGSSSPQQTGDYAQTDHIANLKNKTEGIHEYSRDSDRHNYFILEGKALQEKVEPGIWNVQKPHAVVGDEANCSTLGTEDKQYDAAHEYFVLEHLENGQN